MKDESTRIEILRKYEILDTPKDGAFDYVTKLATMILNVPISIVSLVDTDRIWFKSAFGLDITEIPKEKGLCASAIIDNQFYEIENAIQDYRTLENSLVQGEFGLRFYAAIPLTVKSGHNLGTLCVLDKKSRKLSEKEQEILKYLANIVVEQLELRLSARQAISSELQMAYMLKAIYESTTEASTFIGKDFIIRYNNQVSKNITKHVFGREAQINENSLDYFLPEYREEFRNFYEQVLLGESFVLERTDGTNWWQISLFPVYDKEQNIIGIANNVQDITDRKNKEQKLIQQNEVLRQIAWQQSHELRRPVANILGLCDLLKNYQNETKEMKIKYIDCMLQATNELDKIIHKIVLQANESEYNK
jgi:PAS domain S-box-containing protein